MRFFNWMLKGLGVIALVLLFFAWYTGVLKVIFLYLWLLYLDATGQF